ncbi:cellulase family glycosylhydrolase [Chitinophaga sp. XS-30]|uniref:cellulase family glycosylhydrolase n=1 Tax=Chitinophaga sp. XS-30 TaxID=2604421 RepID=UPI0011DCBDD4|nr:cellulase family glycosylhydrolase [Chitinophaga sp. XS-30]QEH42725.1 cellulase family glycosylhydrolase [Chitinophaga sp. XS-30]
MKILFLILLLPVQLFAQGFLKTSGEKIVNEKGENVLLRGIGLGGWMLQEGYMLRVNREGQQHKIRQRMEALVGEEKTEAFYDAWLANHTTKADIDAMKAWGFNSVRLPMHFNLYTLPVDKEPVAGKHTWLETGFAMTDSLLAWCRANEMYLILDLHAAPGGQGNDLNISDRDGSKPSLWENEAHQQKTVALWRKIAERYGDESWIGGYDIINEPNFGFEDPENDKNGLKEQKNEPLKELMMEITKAIREVDNNHIIIIEGNGWGNNYKGILPPWDGNMVLSFHKYWNFNTVASIQHILDYRNQYNIPVWLGETGENSNVWFTQAIRLLEDHNIGWAWWPLKKLGSNNPLEIKSNEGYDQILRYWSNNGPKPGEAMAWQALMQLAADTRFENNIYHRDVIDAMLRQPYDTTAIPFKTHTPGVIPAVDYDLGINGVAYYDTDTANYRVSNPAMQGGNRGRMYRNDGVDIGREGNEYFVTHIETGEWLQYTLDVPNDGNYRLQLQVAADSTGGKATVLADGKPAGPALPVPATGGDRQWQLLDAGTVPLKKGSHTFRVRADTGGFNLKAIIVASSY